MLITGIKSKPVYAPLRADTGGRFHLMLACGPGAVALLRVLGELRDQAPQSLANTRVMLVPETPQTADPLRLLGSQSVDAFDDAHTAFQQLASQSVDVLDDAHAASQQLASQSVDVLDDAHTAFQQLGSQSVTVFDDVRALLGAFRTVLDESLMGTRLYVAGPESFIGRAMQIALQFDLNKDEIRAEELGTLARRVYCVHCRATVEDVRTNIVQCTGCDRWLLVRDHYSRRLAAYMGVMVDAEAPGELPPIREAYP
jgi:hypothetical protein